MELTEQKIQEQEHPTSTTSSRKAIEPALLAVPGLAALAQLRLVWPLGFFDHVSRGLHLYAAPLLDPVRDPLRVRAAVLEEQVTERVAAPATLLVDSGVALGAGIPGDVFWSVTCYGTTPGLE